MRNTPEDFKQLEKFLCAVTKTVMHTPILLNCCNNHVDASVITDMGFDKTANKDACPCCENPSTLSFPKNIKIDVELKRQLDEFLVSHPCIVKEYKSFQTSPTAKTSAASTRFTQN